MTHYKIDPTGIELIIRKSTQDIALIYTFDVLISTEYRSFASSAFFISNLQKEHQKQKNSSRSLWRTQDSVR